MRVQTEQVAYLNEEAGEIEINERLLPASIRHKSGELAALLNEKFKDAPANRATRRQVEREVTNWTQRALKKGFIHRAEDGSLEVVPEEFPELVRPYIPALLEELNQRYHDEPATDIVLRRMSRFIEDWIERAMEKVQSNLTAKEA